MAAAGPMASLADDATDEFALLAAKSAHFLPLLLLCMVQSRMLLLEAGFTVTIVSRLSLWGFLATSDFVIPLAVLDGLRSTCVANQRRTEKGMKYKLNNTKEMHR